MKKILGIICCFALAFMLFVPVFDANAISKIDSRLISAGLDSNEMTGFFVEFDRPTVVMSATFGGAKVFESKELMRSDNLLAKSLLKSEQVFQLHQFDAIKSLAPDARIIESYQYAFNGCYVESSRKNITKLAKLSSIKRIFALPKHKLHRTRTRALIGAEKTWATIKDPSGKAVDGSGVLVSVSDSGLDYTHPDFGSQKQAVGSKIVISRDLGEGDNDCQEDENELSYHGTACASLIAGNRPAKDKDKILEKGIAPKALLAGYKISKYLSKEKSLELYDPAIMKSWEYMITDKVNVSNNSYGAPGGFPEMESPQYNCALAGVTVVASNGNEGSPGPQFFAIPQSDVAAAFSVIGVGATDDLDYSRLKVIKTPLSEYENYEMNGFWGENLKPFDAYEKILEVVDCNYGSRKDFSGNDVRDKIALIQLGPKYENGTDAMDVSEKIMNAASNNAKAVLLYNNEFGVIDEDFENVDRDDSLPTYNLTVSDGKIIKKLLYHGVERDEKGRPKKMNSVSILFSKPVCKGAVAEFSSNGPTKLGYLKPDVCAPGYGIHSAWSKWYRTYFKSDYMEDFGGTSASGPFVAGCAALIKQAKPQLTPFEIKRVLMNTATMLKRLDGKYYYPLTSQGMGRVDVANAINTQITVQPPSALLLNDGKTKRVADVSAELTTQESIQQLPEDIARSTFPLKLYNYSQTDVNADLSFEINSGRPEQFDIKLTDSTIKIPAAGKEPGVAWVGLNIEFRGDLKGSLNDVIVWITDKATNTKIHTGVCIYNYVPAIGGSGNTFVSDLRFDKTKFTPNGDGIDDEMEISFDATNGSWVWYYFPPLYLNWGQTLCFWATDSNNERWALIKVFDFYELGPYKFKWDGKDAYGRYILPDGDWKVEVGALCTIANERFTKLYDSMIYHQTPASFEIEQSTIPPLPTITAYTIPIEPGVGQDFEIGLHIRHAKDVKGVKLHLSMPGASKIMQYVGYEKTEFVTEEKSSYSVEYDKEKEQAYLNIVRESELLSGDGWLVKFKFFAIDSNIFDLNIEGLEITIIDDKGEEMKTKAFVKNNEASIFLKSYDPCDFNRDGKIDDADNGIIRKSLGSKDGDPNYNWRCDLNFDRTVNIEDYAIFCRAYNKR
jgi:subtilisin family serine protease